MAKQITGNFEWRMPPTVIPTFVQGADAKRLYDEVSKVVKSGLGYDAQNKTMWGSNVAIAARVDTIMRPLGIRVATLRDLSRPEVMDMMRDDFYSDSPELVLRTVKDSYEPNKAIIEALVDAIETKEGKLQLPLKVSGFDVVKAGNQYGWNIVPRDDFAIVHDKRLLGNDGKTFASVDENGLPEFDKKGRRTWYARDEGLSRLYLNRNLLLYSNDVGDLASSYENGRVALIRGAEGVALDTVAKK